MDSDQSFDVDHLFDKQDEALKLLAQLRSKYFATVNNVIQPVNQRRQYRRWSAPDSISVEIYTDSWDHVEVIDVGIGGVKIKRSDKIPASGPFVCKLSVGALNNLLVLGDIMWMSDQTVGIRFEFDNQSDHDMWAENLVDTLLSKLSV